METTANRTARQPSRSGRRWVAATAAVTIVVGLLAISIGPRVRARVALNADTANMAVATVSVVRPERSAPEQEIVLPANLQPFIDAPIYARTNGYLKRWLVDIGARVKAGQLLAEIETPEVDQQLRQSRADLATAEANLRISEITADRYQSLVKTNAVSKQAIDNAQATYVANKAIVQSNQANVKRLEDLQSFESIYAPFDGVITARNTDIGALISSGSSGGPTTELFHIVQPEKLRVYVDVPQAYSQAARPGLLVDVTLAEFPGRRFQGKLIRTANAIDLPSRTLRVEIEMDNPTGTLLTGAYAEAHLKIPTEGHSYILPVNTLLFRSEGLRIATVGEGSKVELTPVTPGHDFGDRIEIAAGLEGDESVIVNPPDSIVSGQPVRIVQAQQPGS